MCSFHGAVYIKGTGLVYLNKEQRKQALKDKQNPDSHEYMCKILRLDSDKVCHEEYNPLLDKLETNNPNKSGYKPDDEDVLKEYRLIDYRDLCKLVIKPFINPLTGIDFRSKITKDDLRLLLKWASVWSSVRASVRASVGSSVWDSVWDSVWSSVRASVGSSVWSSVWDSVWSSVWASVGDSVWASVGASVGAYIGSFFDIKYEIDITPSNKLWERGLVPSFDGKTWRLHSGPKAEIVWSGTVEELKKACR